MMSCCSLRRLSASCLHFAYLALVWAEQAPLTFCSAGPDACCHEDAVALIQIAPRTLQLSADGGTYASSGLFGRGVDTSILDAIGSVDAPTLPRLHRLAHPDPRRQARGPPVAPPPPPRRWSREPPPSPPRRSHSRAGAVVQLPPPPQPPRHPCHLPGRPPEHPCRPCEPRPTSVQHRVPRAARNQRRPRCRCHQRCS